MVSLAAPAGAMLPPPTPLKRPTLGLKRDSSYLDTDDEAGLSTATKKLKVAFSPNVDVRIMEDWTEKSFGLVKEEVRLGIERHLAPGSARDDTQYIRLLQTLGQDVESSEAPSGKLLKKYLLAIDTRVSAMGECGKLAGAILDISWLGRDDEFAGLYTRFLASLATAHSKFIPSILEKLVSHFARLPASLGRLPGETPVSRAEMFRRAHMAIRTVLRRIPSSSAALMRALRAEFPHDLATTRSYTQYQKHTLRITSYLPELEPEILAMLTQRLVGIDEQIQLDLEDIEEEAEDSLLRQHGQTQRVPHSSPLEDSDDSDMDSVSESEETVTEEEQRLKDLRAKVAKMDETMDLLFGYYTPLIEGGLKAELNDTFKQLLSHFESFVRSHRTRHVQFLIFHFSQTLPEHAGMFARQCLSTIFEAGKSLNVRLSACAYLASFVARAAHLPKAMVREIFSGLCQELEEMRKRYEPGCRGPDKRSYSVYYAIAQALLYLFCFRWRDLILGTADAESGDEDMTVDDLVAEGHEIAWLPGIREALHRNVFSTLNPLRVCSPIIVEQFAEIARHVRFMYVHSKLETNKRVRLTGAYTTSTLSATSEIGRRGTAMDRKHGEAHLQLEAYFPFDPYDLPKSKHWVEGDSIQWKAPPGMEEDDGDSDGSEEERDETDVHGLDDELLPPADTASISS